VDAFRRCVEVRKLSAIRGAAPLFVRSLPELASLRLAIFLDHLRDPREPFLCVGPIDWHR
jgi:hypothetical protein